MPCNRVLLALFSLAVLWHPPSDASERTLLFEDRFERNESQETKDELGNGWGTNSDKRAGGNKQVDLGDGTLRIVRHATADHAVSVVHPASYKDCRVELRFRLTDQRDDLGIDFADMKCQEVHAGHICKVFFRPEGIEIQDLKSGRMNKAFRDALKAGTATLEQKVAVKQFQKTVNRPIALNEWHSAVVSIHGDTISVRLDGKDVGSFSSPGIDHPHKDMIRFSARRNVQLDDIRMFAIDDRDSANVRHSKPAVDQGSRSDREASKVRHLFVAKLLLRRLQAVDATPEQLASFSQLSRALRERVDRLRAHAGITQATIKRRDEIYSELKRSRLKGDALYDELQKRGGFTDAQRDGFQETQRQYAAFKEAVFGLLTKAQQERWSKAKRTKGDSHG